MRPLAVRFPRSLLLVVSVATVALLGVTAPPVASQEEDPNARREYEAVLEQEVQALADLDVATRAKERFRTEAFLLQARVDQTRRDLLVAEQQLVEAVAAQERAANELTRAQQRVVDATAQLRREAVHTYIYGSEAEATESLLTTSDDVGKTAQILTYAEAIVDHRQDVVAELNQAKADRNRLADAAADAETEATSARDDIAATRRDLELQFSEKALLAEQAASEEARESLLLIDLQGRKVEIQARITQMERESDGLGMIIADHQRDQPDWKPGVITMVDPLPRSPMTSPFGWRFHPILHYDRLHAGQDISAPSGTPIYAAADGTVIVAEVRGGYGNATVIDHGTSLSTLYAHQSQIRVTPGQQVKAGDLIGAVGSTGMSTGPHLHFETRLRGTPIDPTFFLLRPA